MLSPKKLTRLGLIVGAVSLIGLVVMSLGPNLGLFNWWPAVGFGLALLLFVAAYLRGAYLTAQRRAELVDLLNDCYQGVEPGSAKVDG